MHVDLSRPAHTGSIPVSTYVPYFGRAEGRAPTHAGTTVSISQTARQLNAAAKKIEAEGEVDLKTAELKNYIKSIDFRAVSPAQMNELASKLVRSGELSADQVSAFMGIENDTVQPKNPADKIDVMDHFKMMYAIVAEAAKSDPTLNFGVQWRQASMDVLGAVQRFASSDRAHIDG